MKIGKEYKNTMKEYQALLIIDSDKEQILKEVVASATESITRNEGKIIKEENWGKQRIAYPIEKKKDGIYYKFDFSIDPLKISELKQAYKLNPNILRVMITVK